MSCSPLNDTGCSECRNAGELDFEFTMAFQPIVTHTGVFAHEALVRGPEQQGAGWVFEHVNDSNRYRFDQTCRVKAIELAAKLKNPHFLSINVMPNAVYDPERCIRTSLAAARKYGFPVEKMIFEFTESEEVQDLEHLKRIVRHYKKLGFKTAIDDFGSGYAGLSMLADLQTDLVKLDMGLVRGIETDERRQAIVRGMLQVCMDLDIRVIAEGVETLEEYQLLSEFGVNLFQGFLFAKPAFQALADVNFVKKGN